MDKTKCELPPDGRLNDVIGFEQSRYYSNLSVLRIGRANSDTLLDLSWSDLLELNEVLRKEIMQGPRR